ncbi:MAG TPA: tRNA (adenosine(37)-N6)-threonylcarbamoyltransferase complex dimerization subunit type 1 TsaB [Solirubrobacteraceae bacterium]|nr:tRNA (adenosine(37)-N6)-threonylcarbamoyltransferase complex dimerization subunit type 1 TsaB [Solirubrobacteraceae bacterium]
MILLALDTSTPATAVALRLSDGTIVSARHDPAPDERPGHSTRLLPLAAELLAGAQLRFADVNRIAVGVGPGTFTGLRIGLATGRGLAQSLACEIVGVSSLLALAAGALPIDAPRARARPRAGAAIGSVHAAPDAPADPDAERAPGRGRGILAVLDARRGEVFAAAYVHDCPDEGLDALRELAAPRALPPERLGSVIEEASARDPRPGPAEWLAVGDGAVRFRGELAGLEALHVPADDSPLHLLAAERICALALHAEPRPLADILPDYLRRPDAEIALERAAGAAGAASAAGAAGAPA